MFLYYLRLLDGNATLGNTIRDAVSAYDKGDFAMAERIFHDGKSSFIENEVFQEDYYKFLTKMGRYEEIIGHKGKTAKSNMHYVDKAEECLKILQTNSLLEVSKLVDISPNFFDAVIAAAEYNLQKSNFGSFNKYVYKANILRPSEVKITELKARMQCTLGNYTEGVRLFKEAGAHRLAAELDAIRLELSSIKNSRSHPENQYMGLERLYSRVLRGKIQDDYTPSVFVHFYNKVLSELTMLGVQYKLSGVHRHADRLIQAELSTDTAFLLIKSAVIDQKPLDYVKGLLQKHEALFNRERLQSLKTTILLYEKTIQEHEAKRQQQQRQEQQRRYQRQQSQASQRPAGEKGKDFLKYYEVLGVTNKVGEKEIKKGYKRAVRIASSKKNDDKVKNEKLQQINKAYKVLSDPKRKSMYDNGIDPDNPQPQFGGHHFGQQGSYMSIDPNDLNDIFSAFFGGSGGNNRSGYSFQNFGRQNSRFFHF